MFAEALRVALGAEPDLDVVGVVTGVGDLDAAVEELRPSVALVDLDLPGLDPAANEGPL